MTNTIGYSKELVSELKELFPEYTRAIELAEENSLWLKEYISDSFNKFIHPDEIMLATSLEDLQEKAKLINRKKAFVIKLENEYLLLKRALYEKEISNKTSK